MPLVGVRIPIGAEGTCPRCNSADATQRVSVITHAFADALTPREFEAISFSRSRGEITDWAAPRAGSWEHVVEQINLPEKPKPPLILRLIPKDSQSLRNRLFAVAIIMLVVLIVSPFREWWAEGLTLLSPLLIFALGYIHARRKQREYDAQLVAWGMVRSKWSGLRYCARDNTIFVPGESQIMRPEDVRSYLSKSDSM